MKVFSMLLAFALVGICLGAEPKPAPTSQGKEPIYAGKTLGEWIARTKDKDKLVRRAAAVALGNIGPAGVPALAELLKDKDWSVRVFVAPALGQIGPEAKTAIPALAELLKNENEVVRLGRC